MPRSSSRTIRVDRDSHAALRDLSRRYREEWGVHVSLADLIRMGISLLNRDIANRERTPTPEDDDAGA